MEEVSCAPTFSPFQGQGSLQSPFRLVIIGSLEMLLFHFRLRIAVKLSLPIPSTSTYFPRILFIHVLCSKQHHTFHRKCQVLRRLIQERNLIIPTNERLVYQFCVLPSDGTQGKPLVLAHEASGFVVMNFTSRSSLGGHLNNRQTAVISHS